MTHHRNALRVNLPQRPDLSVCCEQGVDGAVIAPGPAGQRGIGAVRGAPAWHVGGDIHPVKLSKGGAASQHCSDHRIARIVPAAIPVEQYRASQGRAGRQKNPHGETVRTGRANPARQQWRTAQAGHPCHMAHFASGQRRGWRQRAVGGWQNMGGHLQAPRRPLLRPL